MNYGKIKNLDIANGEGVRISLFVSGCTHHCKNCFNQETWDFNYGEPFTQDTINQIIKLLKPKHVAGLTLLGGEPLHPNNQPYILDLIKQIRVKFGDNKNIWCYTGYTYDDLSNKKRAHTSSTDEILSNIDVLVDGLYIDELRNISLKFRGSSNQRVIDVKKTLQSDKVILYLE